MINVLSLIVVFLLSKCREITSQQVGSLKYAFIGSNETGCMNRGGKFQLLITRALSGPFEGRLICEPSFSNVINLNQIMNDYNVAVFEIFGKNYGQETVTCFQTERIQDLIELNITVVEREQSAMDDNYIPTILITGLLILHFLHGLETKFKDAKFVYKYQATPLFCFLLGQLVLVPPVVLSSTSLIGFEPEVIQSLLLISSFPVPWFNVPFTRAIDGEIAFSRVLTLCVPILGIVVMPFNLWFYSWFLHFQNPDVMHSRISVCLAILVFSKVFGLLINHFCPNRSECCIKPLKIFCTVAILAIKILVYHQYKYVFRMVELSTLLHVIVIPVCKLLVGILISTLVCSNIRNGSAIITNMFIQNSMLSLMTCRHIYQDGTSDMKSVIIILHDFVTILLSLIIIALHHVLFWVSAWYRETMEKPVLEDEEEPPEHAVNCPVISETLFDTSQA